MVECSLSVRARFCAALERALPGGAHAPGMLDALVAAAVARPDRGAALEAHYCGAMPALRMQQRETAPGVAGRLFSARLELPAMPRLREGLERLFALVAGAGLDCRAALGAETPRALIAARPTLGALYAGCHFGRSMPMLYAYPNDLAGDPLAGRSALELIEARYVGPLVHELSHLHPLDAALVPAPTSLHEALAAFIGQRAWPASIWPDERTSPGGEPENDALPGGAFFASIGGWVARAIGEREAVRAQAGALDLADPSALGPDCAAALRLFGFLPFLDGGAPHLLGDAFRPDRFWKLIDIFRDPARREALQEALVRPLLAGATGAGLLQQWNAHLDAIALRDLPAASDEPARIDHELAEIARCALLSRSVRAKGRFVARRTVLRLTLNRDACILQSDAEGPDAIGAPTSHPHPPSL